MLWLLFCVLVRIPLQYDLLLTQAMTLQTTYFQIRPHRELPGDMHLGAAVQPLHCSPHGQQPLGISVQHVSCQGDGKTRHYGARPVLVASVLGGEASREQNDQVVLGFVLCGEQTSGLEVAREECSTCSMGENVLGWRRPLVRPVATGTHAASRCSIPALPVPCMGSGTSEFSEGGSI